MKKLFVFIFVLFIFVLSSQANNAEHLEVNIYSGEVRFVDPQWRSFTTEELQAYENPGQSVHIYNDFYWEKSGYFHALRVKKYNESVLFKDNKLVTVYEHGQEYSGERIFLWPIWLLALTIFIMIIANLRGIKNVAYNYAYLLQIFNGVIMIGIFDTIYGIPRANVIIGIVAVIVAFLSVVLILGRFSKKAYMVSSAIFYTFNVVSFISLAVA